MGRVVLQWDPFDQLDSGPCIDVSIMNSRQVIEAGRILGFEYPEPRPMKALLDTGAAITVVSKVWANNCKLFQTNEGSKITSFGAYNTVGNMPVPSVSPVLICGHSTPLGSCRLSSRRSDPMQSSLAGTFCETGC